MLSLRLETIKLKTDNIAFIISGSIKFSQKYTTLFLDTNQSKIRIWQTYLKITFISAIMYYYIFIKILLSQWT